MVRLAAVAALVATTPAAAATRFEVVATGTLLQNAVGAQTLDGLPFGTGSGVIGRWTVDIDAGTATAQTPPGTPTTGEAKLIFGAIRNGFIGIQSSVGDIFLTQGSASLGGLYALDNVAAGGDRRVDQLTITDGTRATPDGLVFGYTNNTGGFLPAGVFLGSVAFGRVGSGTIAAPPTLLTSLDNLDPFSLWQSGPYTFGLNFRSGTATTQAEYLALPVRSFSVINPSVFIIPIAGVPEPGSWAMLVVGFGLVGATLRRQVAVSA